MSINLTLVVLEPSLADRLRSNPSLSEEIEIEPSQDDLLASHGLQIDRTLSDDEYPFDRLALGKDWHLMDQFFTGRGGPRLLKFFKADGTSSFLTSGGASIGEGSGYGPARLLSARECGDIDTFLAGFDVSSALEGLTMEFIKDADVYVYSQGNVPIEEIRRIARSNFEELKSFFRRASTAALSAYIFMS